MMAHIQIFSGEPAAVLQTLDASMKLDPHYPDVLLQFIADARFALGEYELAIAAIEQRLARNAQSEIAYALLASCTAISATQKQADRPGRRRCKSIPSFR